MTDLERPAATAPDLADTTEAADAANAPDSAAATDAANAAPLEPPGLSAADAAFLERCREDLAGLFEPADAVEEIALGTAGDGSPELEARVVVSGRPATFAASGETVVEAYGRLRALAPEQRVALAFRALVDPPARP